MKIKVLIILIILIGLGAGGFFVWKNISGPEEERKEVGKEEVSVVEEELEKEETLEETEAPSEEELPKKEVAPEEIIPEEEIEEEPVEKPIVQKCTDGTLYGKCSASKPKYCDNGNLMDRCSVCGCSSGQQCQVDESCIVIPKGSVAIFVDENTYNQLLNEINRYKSDIQNDLSVDAFLYHNNWQNADQIRNIIIGHYQNDDLLGSVLIGDIPTSYFEGGSYGDYPSDYYYMDLSNKFQDQDNNGRFEGSAYQWIDITMPEVWSGRIKPPIAGAEGISLLKDYFDRNHDYRTGQITYPQRTLYLDSLGILEYGFSESEYADRVDERNSQFYESNQIDIIYSTDPEVLRNTYLSKLKNQYESVFIYGHGASTLQSFDDSYIYSNDIKNIQPNSLFVELCSCSNGDLEIDNYIGGWYLFSGQALVVDALTSPAFGDFDQAYHGLKQLGLGITFGEVYVSSGYFTVNILLGDPTLRLRTKPTGSQPNARQSSYEINFGEVVVGQQTEKKVTLYNDGDITLEAWKTSATGFSVNGGVDLEGPAINMVSHGNVYPHSSRQLIFRFEPLTQGIYGGTYILQTNDPIHPYIKIHLKGTGI